MPVFAVFASCLIGYLLGSFSTGLTVAHFKGVNLRELGSKSTGATNALRVMGVRAGLLTFLGDFLKAALAFLLAFIMFGKGFSHFAAVACIIGHCFPIYYGFKGGKGVTVSVAITLLFVPKIAVISILVCLILIAVFRYVSLGSLSLVTASLLLSIAFAVPLADKLLMLVLFIVVVLRHSSNIKRLISGNENKLNFGSKANKNS